MSPNKFALRDELRFKVYNFIQIISPTIIMHAENYTFCGTVQVTVHNVI